MRWKVRPSGDGKCDAAGCKQDWDLRLPSQHYGCGQRPRVVCDAHWRALNEEERTARVGRAPTGGMHHDHPEQEDV